MSNSEYELLLICYKSGQISERQWQQHLQDEDFKKYLIEKNNQTIVVRAMPISANDASIAFKTIIKKLNDARMRERK